MNIRGARIAKYRMDRVSLIPIEGRVAASKYAMDSEAALVSFEIAVLHVSRAQKDSYSCFYCVSNDSQPCHCHRPIEIAKGRSALLQYCLFLHFQGPVSRYIVQKFSCASISSCSMSYLAALSPTEALRFSASLGDQKLIYAKRHCST